MRALIGLCTARISCRWLRSAPPQAAWHGLVTPFQRRVFALIIAITAIAFLSTLRNWAKFCYSWTGRGAAFIFLGFSALNPGSLMYLIVPCIVVLIGVVYCILGCACPIPVPLPFMFAADLIDEHERENPGYIDARRKHNARKAQARLNKVAQKKTEERQALATREHDLARQEAEARAKAAAAAKERQSVARERKEAFA